MYVFKDRGGLLLALCGLLIFAIMSCTAKYTDNTEKTQLEQLYSIVNTSHTTYTGLAYTVKAMYEEGVLAEEDYKKIEHYADIYADAHNTAIEAIQAFLVGAASEEDVAAKIASASVALTRVIGAATPYLVKGGS